MAVVNPDEKKTSGSSPVKNGFLIFLLSVFISAVLITMTYLPWKSYLEFQEICTEATTGTVTEDCTQVKDDESDCYYGPTVEFTVYPQNKTIRIKCVNTVNLNTEWKENEAVALYYNPDDYTVAILRNDSAAADNFHAAAVVSALLCAVGLCVFIAGIIKRFRAVRPTKYKTNAAGQTFEEWQNEKAENSGRFDIPDEKETEG